MTPIVTGVVLAGGEGRRMGGIDKGLQDFRGQPLVRHVIDRLSGQVDRLVISANRNLERYRTFGVPVLPDLTPGFAGPLAGLQAAFAVLDTPVLVSAPCDSPRLPPDLVRRLYAGLQEAGADLAVPRCGGRVHRAFCLVRRELAPRLDEFLASGGRRLGEWHALMASVEVDFDDNGGAFDNFNTVEQLGATPVTAGQGGA